MKAKIWLDAALPWSMLHLQLDFDMPCNETCFAVEEHDWTIDAVHIKQNSSLKGPPIDSFVDIGYFLI